MKKLYKHHKGGRYLLLTITNQYIEHWDCQAVYASCEDGKVYSRPLVEFLDKFEEVK